MAIQGTFNLSQAISSQSYAYKCWYNFNYGGNTMNISSNDMSRITQTWSGSLSSWKVSATNDNTKYEISDDDWNASKLNGRQIAQDKTGYNGGKGSTVRRACIDSGLAVVGQVAVRCNFLTRAGSSQVADALTKDTVKGDAAVSKHGGNSGTWIVAAPLALATGSKYIASRPNEAQKNACEALQDEMVNSQMALCSTQEEMNLISDELTELSDTATEENEESNEEMEKDKTEFDLYKASYDALMAKINSGETLTEDEKNLLSDIIEMMQQLGVDIQLISEDTTDVVAKIYDTMGEYQEDFDTAAETVAEVEGLTDFAESFDSATRTACYVESAAQGLNAATGTEAATRAGIFAASAGWATAWAWGFVGMGTAAAAMSGKGIQEQMSWAGEVGTEIGMREDVQDLNADTLAQHTEHVDNYVGCLDIVEDLELEIPDDVEAPEGDTPDGEGGDDTPPAPSPTTNSSDMSLKKEDEEET